VRHGGDEGAVATEAARKLGHTVAPARFVMFVLVSLLCAFALCLVLEPMLAWILGFDLGAASFLISLAPVLHGADSDEIRRHARDNDANRKTVVAITLLVASVVFSALALATAAESAPGLATRTATIVTLALCWMFVNAVYTLHYAHLFYRGDDEGADSGGLTFPGKEPPDYYDFGYFALTIGMTFQTSDVVVTGRAIRREVMLHALASFVFNLGVVAFAINVIGASSR
jgi:uncharacterized membrane protein